jgi:uncharacterized membrane protein YccC
MALWSLAERSAIILIEDVRMGEVIRLEEIDRERRRSRARVGERAHLERAVALLRENLAAAADELRDGPRPPEQVELLERIERFAAMIRYGLRMLGEAPGGDNVDGPSIVAGRN